MSRWLDARGRAGVAGAGVAGAGRAAGSTQAQTQTHSSSVLFVLGMLYLHSNSFFSFSHAVCHCQH